MSTPSNRPFMTVPLQKGLSAKVVRKGIARGRRLNDVGKRTLAFYLHEMQTRGLHAETGHVSAVHYAESREGLKRRTARHYLAVGEALDQLPLIDRSFLDGRLHWSKLRALVAIATPETEAEWLEKALSLTCSDVERAVAGVRKGERPRADRLSIPKTQFMAGGMLDALAFARWELLKERLSNEAGVPMSDPEVVDYLTRHALEGQIGSLAGSGGRTTVAVNKCSDCRSAAVATPDGPIAIEPFLADALACDATSGGDDTTLRERVLARDGRRCIHCNSPLDLHAHHIEERAKGGPDTESNLVTLCRRCHGLVHDGCLSITGTASDNLSIRDKDGNPIAARTGSGTEGIVVRVREPRGPRGPRENSEAVQLQQHPNPVPPDFLARHRNLFAFAGIDFRGEVAFTPGEGRSAPPAPEPAAAPPPDGRPRNFAEFVGQRAIRETLLPAIADARKKSEALEPILLSGTPGLGKTALAFAIAGEMTPRKGPRVLTGPFLSQKGKTIESLLSMSDGDVVFIDEVHALPKGVMESLYEAVQDERVSVTVRSGSETREMAFELPKVTIIAATSHPEELEGPLQSRFAYRLSLEPYSPEELALIVQDALRRKGVSIGDEAALLVGTASRGIAREAIHLARRLARATDADLDVARVRALLSKFGVDERGLDAGDRKILAALRASRRPLSLRTLAAKTEIAPDTIRVRHEPYLIRLGLLEVTPFGRIAG